MQTMRMQGWLDLSKEPALSLSKASRLPEYTRDGRPSNPSTIWRHICKGVLHNGNRVYLESTVQGGRRVTTREAVRRFFERLTLDAPADPNAPTPTQLKNAHRDADKRLAMAGL